MNLSQPKGVYAGLKKCCWKLAHHGITTWWVIYSEKPQLQVSVLHKLILSADTAHVWKAWRSSLSPQESALQQVLARLNVILC